MAKFGSIKRKFKIYIVAISILIGSAVSYSFTEDYFEISKNLEIFSTLLRELDIYYVDDIKPGELTKKGIDEMLKTLDPYTNYIPESDIEDYKFMTTGQYGGIGALIRKKDDYVVVAEPYEGFPAYKAGLRAGDKIIEINGKTAKNKTTSQISSYLKGQPNTTVNVLIERNGKEPYLEIELTREEIKINSVPYYGMVNENIGYIKFKSFTYDSGDEVKKAFQELKKNPNFKGLILDLRGNPGGLLHEAVNITNIFIDKGKDIVYTKGKVKQWETTRKTKMDAVDTEMPIAVLVSRGSASASEIVSGAFQDLDRAVIIGRRTFGKGLVQTTRPISYNAKLKLTTAKYYIPSGRCIQALDYSNKNDDGSVGKVPDSLISEFKTKNGRLVYDGGGILPDIETELKEYPEVITALFNKDVIFEYATRFMYRYDSISGPDEFEISDEIYNDFVEFAHSKELNYITETENLIKDIKESAEKEKYLDILQEQIDNMEANLSESRKDDLMKFKDDISVYLLDEIISRYYFQKGKIQAGLKSDDNVKKAIEVLSDTEKYNSILTDVEKYNQEKLERIK